MTPDHIAAIRADARRAADLLAYAYPGGSREPSQLAIVLASLAGNVDLACDEVERLRMELDGERKANALLNAGMGDVCEGRDGLKHRVRHLETERDGLRAEVAHLRATDVAARAELERFAARAAELEVEVVAAEKFLAECHRASDQLADSHSRLMIRVAELEAALALHVAAKGPLFEAGPPTA